MAKQVTNDYVAILVIIALVISLIGTVGIFLRAPITGHGADTDTSTASFEISSLTDINWSSATLDWGSGYVDELPGPAILNSNHTNAECNTSGDGTVPNGTWNCVYDDLVLQNIGNEYVNITISVDQDNQTLIGGTNPSFQWMFWENTSNVCTTVNPTSFTEITANTNATVCIVHNNSAGDNALMMDVKVQVPSDALTGARTATFIARGETIV